MRNYGRNYGNDSYGRRSRDSRGRYTGRGNYRGEETLEDMIEMYQDYSDGKEEYGAEQETLKSLEYMMKSVIQFIEMLKEDANSQEEMEIIKKYSRKISEM